MMESDEKTVELEKKVRYCALHTSYIIECQCTSLYSLISFCFGATFHNRHLQRLVDLSEKYKIESEKEIQGLKDMRNFEDERGRTHVYVPNPYDSETGAGAALRSSLSAVSREGRRESRSPGKRVHASKSPRRRGTSRSKSPGGLRERDPKSPGRGPKSPGRVSMTTVKDVAAAVSSSPSEAVARSLSVPASAALISSYIDDVRGLELRGGGGYGGVEEHTPNVVRRARLREQQQQLQLQQRIADQLSISTQPRIDLAADTVTAPQALLLSGSSIRSAGVDDIEHVDYSLHAYYPLHASTSTAMNPTYTPSYTHPSLYEGITSPLTPDVPATPLPYPRRALYSQAPPVQSVPQERDGKDKPATSDDTVVNIIQAAQMRRSQRVEQQPSPPIPATVPTRTAPLKASTGSINTGNIPASLESSIADLADIMYALGAAKSSMKADRPRRRHRDMDTDTGYPSNPFNMEGQGSGSVSGSDLHSVRSTSTDSPRSYT